MTSVAIEQLVRGREYWAAAHTHWKAICPEVGGRVRTMFVRDMDLDVPGGRGLLRGEASQDGVALRAVGLTPSPWSG